MERQRIIDSLDRYVAQLINKSRNPDNWKFSGNKFNPVAEFRDTIHIGKYHLDLRDQCMELIKKEFDQYPQYELISGEQYGNSFEVKLRAKFMDSDESRNYIPEKY